MLEGLALRAAVAVGAVAIVASGYYYVSSLRAENKAQAQTIANLEQAQKITKREQESSDRIEIELNTYREKNANAGAGLNDVLARRLRDNCKSTATATRSSPSIEGQTAHDRQTGAIEANNQTEQININDLSSVCTISAQESNRYRAEVRAWQSWYADLQKSRANN